MRKNRRFKTDPISPAWRSIMPQYKFWSFGRWYEDGVLVEGCIIGLVPR